MHVRSVIHGSRTFEVVWVGAVDHAAPHHCLILGIHWVVHHQALTPLLILHLCEILRGVC